MQSHQMRFKLVLPLLLGWILAGCSGLLVSDQPAIKTWWLEPPSLAAAAEESQLPHLALSVAAVPGLDTAHIVTLGPDSQLNHYSSARWPDRIPVLFSSLLKRSLQQAGHFAAISEDSRPSDGPCSARLEIQRFYSLLDDSNQTTAVILEVRGQFNCHGRKHPLSADARIPASGNRMPVVVAAYQRAVEQVIRELTEHASS